MAWLSFGTQHRGTKGTMGLLYIILSLLLNDEVNSAFEVKKVLNQLSWKSVSHHCEEIIRNLTFAVPVVNLSSMTVLDKIDFQGDAWVGYYKTYEYFLFLVCVPLSEIKSFVSATFNITRNYNRPGMCYSFCGLQGYIGLQGDLCYCIEGMTFSTSDIHSVNSSCETQLHCLNGMLCGNLECNKITIYQKVSVASNDIRGIDIGCLIVTKRREYEMTVKHCTNRFPHLCESNNGRNMYLEESSKEDQWVYTITDCQRRGKTPTTFIGNGTNFVFPNSSRSWWTSVVRDLVIRNSSESRTIKVTPLYEGFLRNSNRGIQLEFIHSENNSRKMLVAYMSGKDNEASTPEVKGANKTTGSTERASTMMSSSTHETTIASMTTEKPSNEQENPTIEPAKSTIMPEATTTPLIPVLTVVLPLGLAALALITVFTLSVVCRRRRKAKVTNNEEASKHKSNGNVVPRNSETQQTYYEHEKETLNHLKENDQGNVSSEYDSLKEYNAPFSAPTGNLYDTSNFNIGDGTYAATFSANVLRQVDPVNLYDHVRMKKTNRGKYDHVELQDQRNTVNAIGTYDQGNSLACDNTYYDTCQEKFMLHQHLDGNVYTTANFYPKK